MVARWNQKTPVPVFGLPAKAVAISAGGYFTCAVGMDAKVFCWGFNDVGQLGNGTLSASTTPVLVTGLGGVKSVSVAATHACALRIDGSVWCWGACYSDCLGNGITGASNVPVAVKGSLP